jgi:hypothetical protein
MDTRSNESITSKKEYIYKVECFKSVAEDYITAETYSEAESKSGDLFDSYGLESVEGDFSRWKIAECDDCDELATKMINGGECVLCDDCFNYANAEEEQDNE